MAVKIQVTGGTGQRGFALKELEGDGITLDESDPTKVVLRTVGSAGITEATPSGTINGVNAVFTLPSTPALLMLWKNGVKQRSGAGNDYTLSGSTITFEAGAIPLAGDTLDAVIFS